MENFGENHVIRIHFRKQCCNYKSPINSCLVYMTAGSLKNKKIVNSWEVLWDTHNTIIKCLYIKSSVQVISYRTCKPALRCLRTEKKLATKKLATLILTKIEYNSVYINTDMITKDSKQCRTVEVHVKWNYPKNLSVVERIITLWNYEIISRV